jgi:hypothetical protein
MKVSIGLYEIVYFIPGSVSEIRKMENADVIRVIIEDNSEHASIVLKKTCIGHKFELYRSMLDVDIGTRIEVKGHPGDYGGLSLFVTAVTIISNTGPKHMPDKWCSAETLLNRSSFIGEISPRLEYYFKRRMVTVKENPGCADIIRMKNTGV